jgi:CDP-glucose 4,6-dehydratase
MGMKTAFWKGRKVFVTGATGIVGSWIVKDLLKLSASVVALIYEEDKDSELCRSKDIDKVTKVFGKLEDISCLKKAIVDHQIDTVFHVGAQAIVGTAQERPLETFETNIRGTYNLLEACRCSSQVSRIVVASSDKAYGEQPKLPYTEHMPLEGRFPYEASKSCTDLIAQSYFHSYNLPVAIIRCGNIYGGGDLNWNRIVPGTIRSFYHKESPIIRSDGKFIRDYVYVKDVARTYIYLAEGLSDKKFWGQAFNFSSGLHLSVLELVKVIQKLMKCESIKPKILNQAKGEIHSQYLSSAKIQKFLKWKAQYDLDPGLKETIKWYHDFFSQK